MKTVSLAELTLADFSRWLNTTFRVWIDPANKLEFKLVEASPRRSISQSGPAGKEASSDSFSLVFSGPADRLLPQKMYSFEHDQMGAFALFIVPIGKDANGYQYEAVFNRTAKGSAIGPVAPVGVPPTGLGA